MLLFIKVKKNSITRKRERSSNEIWTNGGQMFFSHLTQHKEKSTGNAQHPRSVFLRNTNHKGALPHFTAKLSGQAKHDLSWQRQQQSNNWSPEKTGRSAAPPPPGGQSPKKIAGGAVGKRSLAMMAGVRTWRRGNEKGGKRRKTCEQQHAPGVLKIRFLPLCLLLKKCRKNKPEIQNCGAGSEQPLSLFVISFL